MAKQLADFVVQSPQESVDGPVVEIAGGGDITLCHAADEDVAEDRGTTALEAAFSLFGE